MTKLMMYLVESGIVLVFFYAFYILVLRKETFFNLNRFFLLGILVFSLIFPFISFDFNPEEALVVKRPIEEISKIRMSYYDALASWEYGHISRESVTLTNGAEITDLTSKKYWVKNFVITLTCLYVFGVLLCLSKLVWAFRWIVTMINLYPPQSIGGVKVVKINKIIAPFSFLNYVFVHEELVKTPEFDQVLLHEKTHIRELHSIDLIFVQLVAAFLWFNPVIWQLIKSLKTTHEYIADRKIITSGYSLVEYQTLLLRQLISNNSYGLVHNFNLSFIKKRITMMKNKKSGWTGKVKVALSIICAVIFCVLIVQCNSSLEAETPAVSGLTAESTKAGEVNLPVLPDKRDPVELDLSNALNFNIANDQLTINGKAYKVAEIVSMIETEGYSQPVTIIMSIDKDQKMGFVRDVQMELRIAEQRKLLYLGQSNEGKSVQTPILLPPLPYSQYEPNEPTEKEMAVAGLDILKINMGEHQGDLNQKKVYDFVNSHINKQSSDYVVSAKFLDDDNYGDYLLNLVYLKDAFNQIYQEKAQGMYGKDLFDLSKEEFKKVREGIPMAISIGDKTEI